MNDLRRSFVSKSAMQSSLEDAIGSDAREETIVSDVPSGNSSLAEKPTGETSAKADPSVRANPYVRPGLVNWHTDFDIACAISRKSGKPVLLFQMLGELDQKFC